MQELHQRKEALIEEPLISLLAEPFAISHGNMSGHNILINGAGTDVLAVMDWQFAGFYPLSENLKFGLPALQGTVACEETEDGIKWQKRVRELIREIGTERKWKEREVDVLLGSGHAVLKEVRGVMGPSASS